MSQCLLRMMSDKYMASHGATENIDWYKSVSITYHYSYGSQAKVGLNFLSVLDMVSSPLQGEDNPARVTEMECTTCRAMASSLCKHFKFYWCDLISKLYALYKLYSFYCIYVMKVLCFKDF